MENKKESEICVIQQLLSQLNLENHVFTMDALHCQKKTVEAIVESNNDYIIKVKKISQNCKKRLKSRASKKQRSKSILRTTHQKGAKSRDWWRYLHHQQTLIQVGKVYSQ
jgi:predicted transposase YbfD/YdcC